MEMRPLTKEALSLFESAFNPEEDVLTLVADTIGGTVTANGLWRIFGRSAPPPGIVQWNEPTLWKTHWGELACDQTCIGEDIFGNQLVCIAKTPDLLIWDHESGSLFTLQVPPMRHLRPFWSMESLDRVLQEWLSRNCASFAGCAGYLASALDNAAGPWRGCRRE